MSRPVRIAKTRAELEAMTLEQINEELKYLRHRRSLVGKSGPGKASEKDIAAALIVRERKFGIDSRR